MKLGVVGATGLVGQHFLNLLSKTPYPLEELRLFSRSKKQISFKKKSFQTQVLKEACFKDLDICFFSAGASVSQTWAPEACKQGAIVIDNSSAFREDPKAPLIVPEVNGQLLEYKPQIISNPNCSTIQLVMALHPLNQAFSLEKVRVTSLQSISGAGKEALESLKTETQRILDGKESYIKQELSTAFNCVPYIGDMNSDGFCSEEVKIMTETKKILHSPDLKISAFTLRVPTLNSHGVAVWLHLKNPPSSVKEFQSVFSSFPGVKVQKEQDVSPHGRLASGKHEVFIGRIRKDPVSSQSWILWIVADNLLKGASLNSLQIMEKLINLKKGV